MNNSVVVNGGLQEKNSRTDDAKNLLSNALSLLDKGIDFGTEILMVIKNFAKIHLEFLKGLK